MSRKTKSGKSFSIVVVGAGNVATHLGYAFQKAGNNVLQVYSRTEKAAKNLALKLKSSFTTDLKKLEQNADIYILAVRDDAISEILNNVKLQNGIWLHTSGSISIDTFKGKVSQYGVFYPLQTFTKNKKVNFKNLPVCLEANNERTLTTLQNLATQISENIHFVNSEQRKQLHLAAVFACNFSNYMYTIAEEILNRSNLPLDILKPLILETAGKIKSNSPSQVQTGPAKRKDKKVIGDHLKLLSENPLHLKIYRTLTTGIMEQ